MTPSNENNETLRQGHGLILIVPIVTGPNGQCNKPIECGSVLTTWTKSDAIINKYCMDTDHKRRIHVKAAHFVPLGRFIWPNHSILEMWWGRLFSRK